MSTVLQEFLDAQMHHSYPLTDESGAVDITGSFTLPTSLITDIFLCAPNLPYVDKTKFYISNVLIRRYFIDITIGYLDGATRRPLGVFRNISTTADPQTAYDFIPSEIQTGDQWTPLYFMTGQIIIGDAAAAIKSLGSWSFSQADDAHSTGIVCTRVSKGLLNVQYVSINDRLFTGNVRLRQGQNVKLSVDTRVVAGQPETVVTIDASLNATSALKLTNDADVLAELTRLYGAPLRTINGLLPDAARNFTFSGGDCTTVNPQGQNALTIANPCAAPCCDPDTNIQNLLTSVANLNLRYAQLKAFFDATSASITSLQNKLLVLGSEV